MDDKSMRKKGKVDFMTTLSSTKLNVILANVNIKE